MSLPQGLTLAQTQNTWATALNPVVESPIVKGQLLTGIDLIVGDNSVNHKLGRKLQGWIIVGIDGLASIYDTQASNQMPNLTLNLVSDGEVTVNMWVF